MMQLIHFAFSSQDRQNLHMQNSRVRHGDHRLRESNELPRLSDLYAIGIMFSGSRLH